MAVAWERRGGGKRPCGGTAGRERLVLSQATCAEMNHQGTKARRLQNAILRVLVPWWLAEKVTGFCTSTAYRKSLLSCGTLPNRGAPPRRVRRFIERFASWLVPYHKQLPSLPRSRPCWNDCCASTPACKLWRGGSRLCLPPPQVNPTK